ncbi:MAG: hypothetical protein AAFR59_02375, partial [Bacteroidota bacterium]
EPDGDGPSLELIDINGDNDDPSIWEASAGSGTPGAANTGTIGDCPPAAPVLSVNEDLLLFPDLTWTESRFADDYSIQRSTGGAFTTIATVPAGTTTFTDTLLVFGVATTYQVVANNAGDGTHEHPTQALLDCFSLREKFGSLQGAHVAIVGDITHSRVALSNIFALNKLGAKVRVCGPPTLIPKGIEALGVEVSYDLQDTLRWADAVNMLRIQLERQDIKYFPSLREYSMLYGLTLPMLERLDKKLVVMHPGPINRGVEITSEVADSEQAIILDQVENGVAVRMAVLYLLAHFKER